MPGTNITMLDAPSMAKLLEQLKRHEGCRKDKEGKHVSYRCPAGKQTIGYGHNLDAWPVKGITPDTRLSEDEATGLLLRDVEQIMEQVIHNLPWMENLHPARRAVLINMAFNMGIATLLTFKNTLNAVKNGDYTKAAEGMLASKWANQVHGRATELAKQMRDGQWACCRDIILRRNNHITMKEYPMEVRITENTYGKCDAGSQLVYPGVNSCLTVTALFGDGSRTGAHLTQIGDWKGVLNTWKNKTTEKQAKEKHKGIVTVFVLGDQGWPQEDKETLWESIGELGEEFGVDATDASLKVESWYGDISIDRDGAITGKQERAAAAVAPQ